MHLRGAVMDYKPTRIDSLIDVHSIVTVHYFQFARGYVFSGERHDFWELVYMDRGSAEIGADDRRFVLKEGEIAFHRPGEFHTIWAGGSKAPDIIVISFESNSAAMAQFDSVRTAVDEDCKRNIANVIQEARAAWANRLQDDYSGLQPRPGGLAGASQMVRINLESLLIRIARAISQPVRQEESVGRESLLPKTRAGRNEYYERLAGEIERYIASHLEERVTVASLCHRFIMSETSLKQLFQRRMGCGVNQYLSAVRHDAAKRLIREGFLNMTAIADACGYHTLHYFSRKFTAMEGMTPTEYARSVKSMSES